MRKLYPGVLMIALLAGCTTGKPETTTIPTDSLITTVVDSTQSIFTWIIAQGDDKFDGTLDVLGGTLTFSDSGLVSAHLIADLRTLKVQQKQGQTFDSLRSTLVGPAFFNTSTSDSMQLRIDRITPIDRDASSPGMTVSIPTHMAEGRLSLGAQTKSIRFPFRLEERGTNSMLRGKFAIDRRDWQIGSQVADTSPIQNLSDTLYFGFYIESVLQFHENGN